MSILRRGFKRLKLLFLEILFGKEKSLFLRYALREHDNLCRYNSINLIEIYSKQLSDIYQHLTTLYMLTVELNLKTILELGTRDGKSTIALLQAAHQIDGEVYSVDIDPCLEARNVIKKHRLDDRWIFIQQDDLKLEWNRPIDHLFIDTTHEFEQTMKELEKYEPYVKVGGIISLHDIIACPDIIKAVEAYLRNRNDLRLYKYLHNNGLGVIFKGSTNKETND